MEKIKQNSERASHIPSTNSVSRSFIIPSTMGTPLIGHVGSSLPFGYAFIYSHQSEKVLELLCC